MAACFLILKCEKRTGADGTVMNLRGDAFTLGRDGASDVAPDADVVSRVHARLRFDAGTWWIEDAASTNGTFVNGRRIESAEVRVGDTLMLGEGGPVYVVVAADGPGAHGDLQETRFLRVARRKGRGRAPSAANAAVANAGAPGRANADAPARKRRAPRATPPIDAPSPGPSRGSGLLVLLPLAGMVAGVLLGAMKLPDALPAEGIAAPGLWAARILGDAFPGWASPRMGRLLCLALALYGSLYGLILQRPLRRLPIVILLGGVHAFAVLALDRL